MPLNTPVIKSIIPVNIGFKELLHKSLIPLKQASTIGKIIPWNTVLKAGAKTLLIKFPIASKQGFKLLFHKLLASVTKPLKKAFICGIRSAKASLTHPITCTIKSNTGCPIFCHTDSITKDIL